MAGRRKYSVDFKKAAVELINVKGYTLAEAAESLHVDAGTLRLWLKKYGTQIPASPEGTTALREQNRHLREQVKRLQMERDILKKAAAFFAGQKS
jgi:transposase